jgi:hypothetical protein
VRGGRFAGISSTVTQQKRRRIITAGGGNDNPDGFPTSGNTYYATDFNTEVEGAVADVSGTVETWGSSFGRGGSGAWRIRPIGESWSEQLAGVAYAPPPSYPLCAVDEFQRFFMSFTLFIHQRMIDDVWTGAPGKMKFLDVRLWDAAGTGGTTDSNGRWVTFLSVVDGQLKFGLAAGGAGTSYYGSQTGFSAAVAAGFVWFCIMYDEGVSPSAPIAAVYQKNAGDPGVTKIVERDSSIVFGAEQYISIGRGFRICEVGALYDWEKTWTSHADQYWVMDDLSFTDYWVGPPVGF